MLQFKFQVFVDISTAHLRESDWDLLSTAPNHLATLDGNEGDFFYLPCDDDTLNDSLELLRAHGMSPEFLAIFEELYRQGVAYVRFDRDADITPGLPIPDGRHFEVDVVEVRHVRMKYTVEANSEDEARQLAEAGDTVCEETVASEVSERTICRIRPSAVAVPAPVS